MPSVQRRPGPGAGARLPVADQTIRTSLPLTWPASLTR